MDQDNFDAPTSLLQFTLSLCFQKAGSAKKLKTGESADAKKNLASPSKLDMEVEKEQSGALVAGTANHQDSAPAPAAAPQQAASMVIDVQNGDKQADTQEPDEIASGDANIADAKESEAQTAGRQAEANKADAKQAATKQDFYEGMHIIEDLCVKSECVASTSSAAPTSDAPDNVDKALSCAKPAAPKPASATKKPKNAMPVEEMDKKIKLLMDELEEIAGLQQQVHGDIIPHLRPEAEEVEQLEGINFNTDAILTAKTKQTVARVMEGSNKTVEELAAWLQGCAAAHKRRAANDEDMVVDENKAEAETDTEELGRFQEAIEKVGELLDSFFLRPDVKANAEPADGDFAKTWSVKDPADIPAEFRAVVDSHRKMGACLKERAIQVRKMIFLIEREGKELPKMDKSLLTLKDKYGKLEEKERKDREKLDTKIETEKKKNRECLACALSSKCAVLRR